MAIDIELQQRQDRSVSHVLQASHNAMGKLYSAHVLGSNTSLECRVTLYKSIILPILNYGSEIMTYGSTTSFDKLSDTIDKRHHTYVKQLLHCRNPSCNACAFTSNVRRALYSKSKRDMWRTP